VTTDADLRYAFACPSCAASFSISLAKIPPVQARFSCPRCGKGMDFPSRDEARVYMLLQSGESNPAASPATPEPEPEPEAEPKPPPPPPAAPVPPSRPAPVPAAKAEPVAPGAEKRYAVDKKGFENDSFDRRAMSKLIRTGALNEFDQVLPGEGAPAVRAGDLPELKSLFELRKTSRAVPPPVCRKHTDVLAHYQCINTERPLCDECAPAKQFGGTTVRVCEHCGGNARDLHAAPGDLS
jgi:predicted Zn finger-like uncharacterized protein